MFPMPLLMLSTSVLHDSVLILWMLLRHLTLNNAQQHGYETLQSVLRRDVALVWTHRKRGRWSGTYSNSHTHMLACLPKGGRLCATPSHKTITVHIRIHTLGKINRQIFLCYPRKKLSCLFLYCLVSLNMACSEHFDSIFMVLSKFCQ